MSVRTACALSFALITAQAAPTAAQADDVSAMRTDEAIVVDAVLSEPAWSSAQVVTGFSQFEPRYGDAASLQTTIRVVYDRRAIYFGIECADPDPSRISSKVTARDGEVWEDDSVALILDTFGDGNSAYFFIVNSIGTQQDEQWADNGRTRDIRWDGTWQSAATRGPSGWTAEVAIPFSTLRFDREGARWGFDAIRYIPRSREMSRWTAELTEWFRISEFGSIVDLELVDIVSDTVSFIPYVQGQAVEGASGTGDVGLDVRYNLSSNIGVEATFNPDFATIEADVEQINLTRFELFFPEKRPFFLEGGENYSTRIQQFYSRRIGEIPAGVKANGKAGPWKFNMLGTRSDPASADPSIAPGEDATYTVFRVGYDLPNASTIGLIGANRSYTDGDTGSLGLAGTFFFTDALGMTSQVIKSHGPYSSGTWAWFARPAYDSRTTHAHVRYTHLGDRFQDNANSVGFIRDDDRREFDTNVRRRFFINGRLLDEITPMFNYNRYWSQEGVLRSWHSNATLTMTLATNWGVSLRHEEEYQLFEKAFRNSVRGGTVSYDSKTGTLLAFDYRTGVNFDRDFDRYGVGATLKLKDGWDATYELARAEFKPDPSADSTFIHTLRTSYYFDTDRYLKLFYQTRAFTTQTVVPGEPDRETLQAVFVWRVLPPFGQLQLAYINGPTQVTEAAVRGHTFFTKLAWVFAR
jgi:hypothetical protein